METKSSNYAIALIAFLLIAPLVVWAQSWMGAQGGVVRMSASLLLIAVVIGVIYNLWKTTMAYGGLIGQGIRWVGVGIMFFSVIALDRVAQNFSQMGIVSGLVPPRYETVAQDTVLLLGLFFAAMGFVKLSSAVKK
jgi:hypothetical protein